MQIVHDFGKYPRTGPNYQQWGEQPGLIYDYARDAYFVDEKQYKEQYPDQFPEEPEPPGLLESLAPVAGTAAALAGGKYIGNSLLPSLFESGGTEVAKEGLTAAATEGGLFSAPTTATTSLQGAASAIPEMAGGQVGTFLQGNVGPVADGAQYASDLAANQGGLYGLSPMATGALGAAGLALGSKGVYDAYEAGDPIMGGISGAGAGLGASMLSSALGLGALGPWGWGAGLAIGLGAGLLGDRETTTEHQQKIAQRLAGQHQNDVLYQNLVRGMGQAIEQGPADPSKPFFSGKYATWDEYKNAGLNAQDLAGQAGVLETVGGMNLTLPQIHQVTQKLIDNDLLYSDRGAVKVSDLARAQQLAQEVAAMQTAQDVTQGQRTNTLSPGIGLDGRPISY